MSCILLSIKVHQSTNIITYRYVRFLKFLNTTIHNTMSVNFLQVMNLASVITNQINTFFEFC